MITVAQSCPSIRDPKCFLTNKSHHFVLRDTAVAILTHAFNKPLTNSVLENPEDLQSNMEVSNCRTLMANDYVDCVATLFNVRITNVGICMF